MNNSLTTSAYTAPSTLLQGRAITPPKPGSTAEQTRKAAQDFEAVFVAQMLQPMFDTIAVDEDFGGGSAEETWRGLLVEEIGKQVVKAGGIGLADDVEREMLKLQEAANGTH